MYTSAIRKQVCSHAKMNTHSSGNKAIEWLCSFCFLCLRPSKLPKIWRWAIKIIAFPEPNKPLDDPKGYWPIALLCVPYKIMERLLHTHLDPVIVPATAEGPVCQQWYKGEDGSEKWFYWNNQADTRWILINPNPNLHAPLKVWIFIFTCVH